MAWSSTVDERYAGTYTQYSAGYYDASNLLNDITFIAESSKAYGTAVDDHSTADIDVYSLGILDAGSYTVDVDDYTWDWGNYDLSSIGSFQVLNSYGYSVTALPNYSSYLDINFTVVSSETYYVMVTGPSYGEAQYSIEYTKAPAVVNYPAISNLYLGGSAVAGEELSVAGTYFDFNGIPGSPVSLFEWYRIDTNGNFSTVAGENGNTYNITSEDVGYYVGFTYAFYDSDGFTEKFNLVTTSEPVESNISNASPVSEVLTKFGYTSINGLVSSWNDETNTVSYSWDNGANAYIPIADYISPSQLDISEVVTFILNEIGYSYISGLKSTWATETNELGITFDSAQVSGLNLTDITMLLDLDESGNVSTYYGEGYNSTYGWVTNNQDDLTLEEKYLIKQAYVAIDSLENITKATNTNDIALIALNALGYTDVTGLSTYWDASTQTAALILDSATYNQTSISFLELVVTTDSSGDIFSYYSTITANGVTGFYDKYDLNDSEVFIIEATAYAMNEIERITSNHDFTNGAATIVFDDNGNVTNYELSIEHSDIGLINKTTSDLSNTDIGNLAAMYSQLNTNNIIALGVDDIIQGTASIDHITTLGGSNTISALAGNDIINLAPNSAWSTAYSAQNISNINSVGTNQKISLDGFNRFSDVIDGGADVDTLNLTAGNDAFFIDDVYSAHHSSLTLSSTTQGIDSIARVVNLEVINAGAGNDIVDLTSANFILTNAVEINGEAGNDILWGSNGDDTINGGEGNDTIFGGSGNDTLTGGVGSDIFQFTATAANDIITDFSLTDDSIQLYYRVEDNHTNTNLNLANGILTWDVDNTSNDVLIDMSATIASSNLNDLDALITFVEIV